MIHQAPHPLAGKVVRIARDLHTSPPIAAGSEYRIEDWVDRVAGKSWQDCDGNPAAMIYAMRTGTVDPQPTDDEVLYGHVRGMGHLVHVSEIEVTT